MAVPLDASSAFAAARRALQQPDFAWIHRSALLEKAYYLGLYHGLAAMELGDGLSEEIFRHLRECVAPRSGDDGFSESPFSHALELMREAIEDPRQPELAALDAALGVMLAHLEEVQRERAAAAAAVQDTVAVIQPFTAADAFRILAVEEHERLQQLVQLLDGQLRMLALVELRWGRRLGLEA